MQKHNSYLKEKPPYHSEILLPHFSNLTKKRSKLSESHTHHDYLIRKSALNIIFLLMHVP